ncbi:MAG: hypothetical protein HFJ04_02330 [Lachnospiraceae bacterium]|nr:hypothetical protein [Lachnospiraceae bacterium]
MEVVTEEQRSFYEMVGDFFLQKKQRQVIGRKKYKKDSQEGDANSMTA